MNVKGIIKGEPFGPEPVFRTKLILTLITGIMGISTGVYVLFSFIGFFAGLDNDPSDDSFGEFLHYAAPSLAMIWVLGSFTIVLLGIILAEYYTRYMQFQILDKEIIVRKGIINKEIKHIPFRTITNVSSRYGVYDRLFGIGTVQIETAGKSGQQTGPEAKIEGISNFYEVRDIILTSLRQFRGQYATATELEPEFMPEDTEKDFHRELLAEIREIKEILSK